MATYGFDLHSLDDGSSFSTADEHPWIWLLFDGVCRQGWKMAEKSMPRWRLCQSIVVFLSHGGQPYDSAAGKAEPIDNIDNGVKEG